MKRGIASKWFNRCLPLFSSPGAPELATRQDSAREVLADVPRKGLNCALYLAGWHGSQR